MLWSGDWNGEQKAERRAEMRARLEHRRRWWRRDVLLMALEVAYPAWLSAPQIAAIAAEIEPAYRKNSRFVTARSLGRLHTYRTVDRIGQPIEASVRKGTVGRPRKVSGAGYRYRLRREAGDFL
jgi:hypothetical protein